MRQHYAAVKIDATGRSMNFERLRSGARSRFGPQLWSILSPDWTLPSGLTVTVESFAEWVIYNDIFVDREYDVPIRHAIEHAGPNPVILDLGANVGYFAIRFAHQWMRDRPEESFRMVGIEGSPHTYETLSSRLDQTPLSGKMDLRLGLAGKRAGEACISTSGFHVTDSIMGANSRSGTSVRFLDLTAILPRDRIALLKCDIEGAEEIFIENYADLLSRTDAAVFELHHEICDVERCMELLHAAGLSHVQRLRDCLPSITVDFFVRNGA